MGLGKLVDELFIRREHMLQAEVVVLSVGLGQIHKEVFQQFLFQLLSTSQYTIHTTKSYFVLISCK